jgi:hypothetical protein
MVSLADLDLAALSTQSQEALGPALELADGASVDDVAAERGMTPASIRDAIDTLRRELEAQLLPRCAHCGRRLRRRNARTCSRPRTCRQRVWLRRRRGLADDAFPEGAPTRGRVPMNQLTRAERDETTRDLAAIVRQATP